MTIVAARQSHTQGSLKLSDWRKYFLVDVHKTPGLCLIFPATGSGWKGGFGMLLAFFVLSGIEQISGSCAERCWTVWGACSPSLRAFALQNPTVSQVWWNQQLCSGNGLLWVPTQRKGELKMVLVPQVARPERFPKALYLQVLWHLLSLPNVCSSLLGSSVGNPCYSFYFKVTTEESHVVGSDVKCQREMNKISLVYTRHYITYWFFYFKNEWSKTLL